MSKIQIIGGSGFIGSYLIKQLTPYYSVVNYDKANSSCFPSITNIIDIREKEAMMEKLQPSEWMILLAAEHRDDIYPSSLYYDVNVQGTKNVLDVMGRKKIEKIIFTSTVAVYGLNKKNPDECSEVDPFNDYGKSKWQAEETLRKWYEEDPDKRTLIIIRPTVVFGPGNKGNVYNLLTQIASGKFFMIGKGTNKKSMAYVENVAGFIKYCIDKNFSGYHIFNYVDKPDLSMKGLLFIVEESLQKKLPPVKIPYLFGYAGGLCFDVLSFFTKKKYAINSIRIKKFCAITQFSSDKMLEVGYKPPYTLKEGLHKTLESLEKKNKQAIFEINHSS